MVYMFFDKKTGSESKVTRMAGINVNEFLKKKKKKAVIQNFKRRKVHSRFEDNILTAGLAEMR